MSPAKKISAQALWHEQLAASAEHIPASRTIELDQSVENTILLWDVESVQTGLARLAESITRTAQTEDEVAIDTNTARLQNIENAIKALLMVEGEELDRHEEDEGQAKPMVAKVPVQLDRQAFTLMDYARLFVPEEVPVTPPSDDPLTVAMRQHVEMSVRVWLLRREEYAKPVSDPYIKECAVYDAYYRLRVDGIETRAATEIKADYLKMVDECFSAVQREFFGVQTTS